MHSEKDMNASTPINRYEYSNSSVNYNDRQTTVIMSAKPVINYNNR